MRNKHTRQLALDAMFIALMFILSISWGFIPTLGASITIMMVPVLVGSYISGWKRGLIYGLAFGFISWLLALSIGTSPLDPYFINPLVSILPRAIFGLVSGLAMEMIRKIKKPVWRSATISISCFILTLFHSLVTLTALGLVAGAKVAIEVEAASYWVFLGAVILSSGLIESAIAAFAVPPLIFALEKYMRKTQRGIAMNYKKIIAQNIDIATFNLQKWINIDSVDKSEEKSDGKPFGEGVYSALRFIGELAEKDGFSVDYCDGYCTEITLGTGKNLIAIYAHADVVPVSGEWKYPPFSATIDQGIMYGRGTSDDKGPALAAYYALKAIKEAKAYNDKYRITLVIGGNEEKGSRCLEYYFHQLHKPYPNFGFTPDGQFPLIYGEKGISNYQSSKHIDLSPIIEIDAGIATNSVIDKAEAKVKVDNTIEEALISSGVKYALKHDSEYSYITIFGKAVHGSTPEQGDNAGLSLLKILGQHYKLELLTAITGLYEDPFGKSMNLFFETTLLHHSTYNVGIIEYKEKNLSFIVNFRYPEGIQPSEVVSKLNGMLPMQTVLLRETEPLLVEPQSLLVTTLLKAYQDETGDLTSQILTIGGGTYARESKNTIAFGSAFPGRNDRIHDANEHIYLEDFTKSISIYAHAVLALIKL